MKRVRRIHAAWLTTLLSACVWAAGARADDVGSRGTDRETSPSHLSQVGTPAPARDALAESDDAAMFKDDGPPATEAELAEIAVKVRKWLEAENEHRLNPLKELGRWHIRYQSEMIDGSKGSTPTASTGSAPSHTSPSDAAPEPDTSKPNQPHNTDDFQHTVVGHEVWIDTSYAPPHWRFNRTYDTVARPDMPAFIDSAFIGSTGWFFMYLTESLSPGGSGATVTVRELESAKPEYSPESDGNRFVSDLTTLFYNGVGGKLFTPIVTELVLVSRTRWSAVIKNGPDITLTLLGYWDLTRSKGFTTRVISKGSQFRVERSNPRFDARLNRYLAFDVGTTYSSQTTIQLSLLDANPVTGEAIASVLRPPSDEHPDLVRPNVRFRHIDVTADGTRTSRYFRDDGDLLGKDSHPVVAPTNQESVHTALLWSCLALVVTLLAFKRIRLRAHHVKETQQ